MTSPSNLTFQQALELLANGERITMIYNGGCTHGVRVPADIEERNGAVYWVDGDEVKLCSTFRNASFRRARPRRSRVRDMAEAWTREGRVMHADVMFETAIRAVCEYLRTKQAEDMAGPCKTSLPETQAVWAARIEREFLEER